MPRRRGNSAKQGSPLGAALLIGTALLLIFSCLSALGSRSAPRAVTAGRAAAPEAAAAPTERRATRTPVPTRLPKPTATPTATPAPPTGSAQVVANLRSEPRIAAETVIGKLCPGDGLHYVNVQQVGSEMWYRVQVVEVAGDCDPQRAPVGAEGWASGSVVAVPSYAVSQYIRDAGIAAPTRIPPTATPRPTARPQAPVAPGRVRVGAICRDGWHSSATGRGACSHHGGVARWLYR